ncbi:hypothetical protein ACWDR0_20575 [Streptomyces sp. NPDC003691]
MTVFRRAAALAATAFALLGSVTLLTFGTSVREIFGLTVGIGA